MRNTFENEMERSRLLLYGVDGSTSIKENIKALFPEELLAKAIEVYQLLKKAAEQQSIEAIESKNASNEFNAIKEELHQTLVKTRKGIRYFYKNDLKTQESLNMDKNIPDNYPEWRRLLEDTFSAIQRNEDAISKLSLINIDTENVIQKLSNLDEIKSKAEKEDGEAQQATVRKTELFTELRNYCSQLKQCLNLIYEGNERQKLEELGITVK